MAMKNREAIDAIRNALTESLRSGASRVGVAAPQCASPTASKPDPAAQSTPEFEFSGWRFFPLDGPFDAKEPNGGGDAKLQAPDGTIVALVWTTTGKLSHRLDLSNTLGPIHLEIPSPLKGGQIFALTWSRLRRASRRSSASLVDSSKAI